LLVGPLTVLAGHPAWAESSFDSTFVAGVTVATVAGAAALTADIGTLVHAVEGEYGGAWAWIAIFSGIATMIGGIVIAKSPKKERAMASAFIPAGILSSVIGIVGVSLPRRDSPAFLSRIRISPVVLSDVVGDPAAGVGLGLRF
jgi:hypothetical protein